MGHISLLVKNNLKNNLLYLNDKANKKNENSNAKSYVKIILIAVLLSFLIFSTLPITMLLDDFHLTFANDLVEQAGMLKTYYTMYYSLFIILTPIAFISTMYYTKDNELLLSLPISNTKVFISKLISVYIQTLLLSFLMFLFGIFPLVLVMKADIMYYVGTFLYVIFLPIVPMFVGALISFPVMWISNLLKNNRILAIIVTVVAVVGFAVLYANLYSVQGLLSLEENFEGVSGFQSVVNTIMYYVNPIAEVFVLKNDGVRLILILIGITAVSIVLIYVLSGLLWAKSVAKSLENSVEKVSSKADLENTTVNSPFKSLVIKEFKMIIRNPMVFLNFLMQIMMPILMLVVFNNLIVDIFGSMLNGVDQTMQGSVSLDIIVLVVCLFIVVPIFCAMNQIGLSSITREGQSFYVMQTMPVPVEYQLKIKLLVGIFPQYLSVIGCMIFLLVSGSMSVLNIMLFTLFLFILSLGLNYLLLTLDLKAPRLDFDNYNQVFKNNKKVLSAMGIGYIPIGILFVLNIISTVFDIVLTANMLIVVVYLIMFIFAFTILLLSRNYYKKRAVEYFYRVSE